MQMRNANAPDAKYIETTDAKEEEEEEEEEENHHHNDRTANHCSDFVDDDQSIATQSQYLRSKCPFFSSSSASSSTSSSFLRPRHHVPINNPPCMLQAR